MEIQAVFGIAFLGVFGTRLLYHQAFVLARRAYPTISGRFVRHISLPRLFRGRHFINPTRIEVLCHIVHWTSAIIYNAYGVRSLSHAATRAAQIAVIHAVPLLAAHQLSFVSHALGLPLGSVYKMHASLGIMTTIQGTFHSIVRLRDMDKWVETTVYGTIVGMPLPPALEASNILKVISALVVLSVLPNIKRYAYELFLYSHRIFAIVTAVALWGHLRTKHTFSRTLLTVTLCLFLASSVWQYSRQVYHNVAWDGRSIRLVRSAQARQCGDSLILELRLPRPWRIHPGQHIHLTLLTLDSASIMQRHPFAITWWTNHEGQSYAESLYIMIDPQRGWTKSMQSRPSHLNDRYVWIEGPFGASERFEDFGTVVLFASGSGVFAQLPVIKGLTEQSKFSAIRTRRIKLVWQTDEYHDQLQEWIQSIMDDKEVDKDVSHNEYHIESLPNPRAQLLDISIHMHAWSAPRNGKALTNRRKIHDIGQRVKVIYDIPDIERYIEDELKQPEKSIAVVGKCRACLRSQIIY